MDRAEALNIFVRNNISLLSSPQATTSLVKRMRVDFSRKMNLKGGAYFTNREIAEAVIKEVSQAKKSNAEDLVQELKGIPFITKEVPTDVMKEIITIYEEKGPSILTMDDLRGLKQKKHLESIERKFEKKAMEKMAVEVEEEKQKLEELISEVEKEKLYLSTFRSELDQLPPEITFEKEDLEVEPRTGIGDTSWWRQIGLLDNPFPSDEGLIGIPKDKYEDIVVRTRFVNTYLTRVETAPEEFLGQSIAIVGEFGSGKTTLLDMICYKLGAKGIFPCKVILMPSPDAGAILNELLRQMGGNLGQMVAGLSGFDNRSVYGFIDSLSKLSLVLEDFKKYGGKGLVVSVDGLHKGSQYFPQTIEFLQQLQNVHEFIESAGVSCCFLLAGSKFWEKELSELPSMGGSISKIDIIPPLSEDDAVEAVVRRIMSFSQSGGAAPTIRKESIRLAYRTLSQRLDKPITFRSFMNHIRDRLKVGGYDEVGIGVSPHFEMVDTIREYIEVSDIGGQFHAIEKRIPEYPDLRAVLCEILPKIYQLRGVEESDEMFKKYVKVFSLLKVQGFIVKRKSLRKGPFVWSISPKLAKALKRLQREHSVSPEDALSSIFESRRKIISRETTTVYSDLLQRTSEASRALRDSWPEIVQKLVEIGKILEGIESQVISGELRGVDSALIGESCRLLLDCVLVAGGAPSRTDTGGHEAFRGFWCAPDNVDEIMDVCTAKCKTFGSESDIFGLLHHHSGIMGQITELLMQLTQGEGVSRLVGRRLVSGDLTRIHKARSLFVNQSYKDAVDVICEILEEKARDIGFPVIRTMWGDSYAEMIPQDITEKLPQVEERGHPRVRRARYANFFFDISRSEYAKILFQRRYRRVIFGSQVKDIHFKQMKDIWEIAFSLGDREAHRDRPKYFREHATEVADVLRVLPIICEHFLVIVERLLDTLEFKYEKHGNMIIGRYVLDDQTLVPKEIRLGERSVQRIMKTVLSSLARNPREAIPMERILIVEGEPIEAQVAFVNAMIRRRLICIAPTTHLEITETGKNTLKDLQKPVPEQQVGRV